MEMEDQEPIQDFEDQVEEALNIQDSAEDFTVEETLDVVEELLQDEVQDTIVEDIVEEIKEEVLKEAPSEAAAAVDSEITDKALVIVQWLQENALLIIGTLVVIVLVRLAVKELRRRWFASFINNFTNNMDPKMIEMKKDIFQSLGTLVSHDPEVRKAGGLKILEIGVGTGSNFSYYPDGTHLTVVDPNPHFRKYYDENRKKFSNIKAEELIVTTGEEMDMVPDNSADVVVVTLVFCSVQDTEKILKNILRVLVPGGKFYFYEHIREFDEKKHRLRRIFQSLLTFTGIWPAIFDNCHLNRDMLKAVEAAGFTKVEAQRYYAPVFHPIFQIIQPSLKGIAEK